MNAFFSLMFRLLRSFLGHSSSRRDHVLCFPFITVGPTGKVRNDSNNNDEKQSSSV